MLNVKKTLTKLLSGLSGGSNCLKLGNVGICWGTIDATSITANEFRTGSEAFPFTFASSPSVNITLLDPTASPQNIHWFVHDLSTSAFTWGFKNSYGGNWGTSHGCWIAIGIIGGYSLKALSEIFSRLAERWWEYAECKEESHQNHGEYERHNRIKGLPYTSNIVQYILRSIVERCNSCRVYSNSINNSINKPRIMWYLPHWDKWEYGRDRCIKILTKRNAYLFDGNIHSCVCAHRSNRLIISERGWSCA